MAGIFKGSPLEEVCCGSCDAVTVTSVTSGVLVMM
jgi:hypothetical protein